MLKNKKRNQKFSKNIQKRYLEEKNILLGKEIVSLNTKLEEQKAQTVNFEKVRAKKSRQEIFQDFLKKNENCLFLLFRVIMYMR